MCWLEYDVTPQNPPHWQVVNATEVQLQNQEGRSAKHE